MAKTYYLHCQGVDHIYGSGYFPRKFHYLRDARKAADNAIELGAVAVKIEDGSGKRMTPNRYE